MVAAALPTPATAREAEALRLAHKTLALFQRRGAAAVDWEEVAGEAMLAAAKALASYDERRGVKFSSFAITTIRGAILESLRQQDWLTRGDRTLLREMEAAGVTPPAALQRPQSLEEVINEGTGTDFDALTVGDTGRMPVSPDDPAAAALEADARARLWQAVGWLPEAERHVIRRYYRDDRTLKQIGREIGKSESRVYQLYAQALDRLRAWLWDTEEG